MSSTNPTRETVTDKKERRYHSVRNTVTVAAVSWVFVMVALAAILISLLDPRGIGRDLFTCMCGVVSLAVGIWFARTAATGVTFREGTMIVYRAWLRNLVLRQGDIKNVSSGRRRSGYRDILVTTSRGLTLTLEEDDLGARPGELWRQVLAFAGTDLVEHDPEILDKGVCGCCGYKTLDREGSYEICPVCWWEDDPAQRKDPEFAGGANEKSLREARDSFAEIGASDVRFVDQVRKARVEEGGPT